MKKYNILEDNIIYSVEEYANGDKYWHLNGEIHRINGPAIEYTNGRKVWYLNGKCHRINGPAIEFSDGTYTSWYYYGTQLICNNLKEFNRQIKLLSIL